MHNLDMLLSLSTQAFSPTLCSLARSAFSRAPSGHELLYRKHLMRFKSWYPPNFNKANSFNYSELVVIDLCPESLYSIPHLYHI